VVCFEFIDMIELRRGHMSQSRVLQSKRLCLSGVRPRRWERGEELQYNTEPVWRRAPRRVDVRLYDVFVRRQRFDLWQYTKLYWSEVIIITFSSQVLVGLLLSPKAAVEIGVFTKSPLGGYISAVLFGASLGNLVGQEANRWALEQMGFSP